MLHLCPRHTLPLLSLGLAVLGTAGVVVQSQDSQPEVAPPTESLRVDAAEVWEHPGRYLGQEVRFRFRHKEWSESWQPYITRFGPAEYRALVGWGEREFPWEEAAWEAPRLRAFVRRGGAIEWALEDAARLQSFELTVVVHEVFASQPWVEVVGVLPALDSIPEGSVLHASRALELMGKRQWNRAEDELERALAAPLPEVAGDELRRLLDACVEQREIEQAKREREG